MPEVKLREKGQVTIPADLLHEWEKSNKVCFNDSVDAPLANGVLIPNKQNESKRSVLSFAVVCWRCSGLMGQDFSRAR